MHNFYMKSICTRFARALRYQHNIYATAPKRPGCASIVHNAEHSVDERYRTQLDVVLVAQHFFSKQLFTRPQPIRSNRKPKKFIIIIMSAALLRLNGRRHEISGATRWWFQCLWILSAGNIFNSIQYVTSAHLSSTSDTLNKLQRYQQDVQQHNRESHEVGLRSGL